MAAPKQSKKISRNEVSELNPAELWELTKDVYSKLYRYMAPFRKRFYLGVFMSIVSGLFSVVILAGLKLVFSVVLSGNPDKKVEPKPPTPVTATAVSATAALPSLPEAAAVSAPGPAVPVTPPATVAPEGATPSIHLPGFLSKIDLSKYVRLEHGKKLPLYDVILLCSLVPVLIFIRGILGYLAKYYMLWVGNRVLYHLRNDVFRSVLNQSLGYFNKAKVGDLIQTVFNQTRVAQTNAVQLSQLIIEKPVAILSTLIYLISQDWIFTLCSVVIFPLCIGPIMYVSKRVRKSGAKEEEEAGAIMVTMHESFAGIRVVKSHAREDYEVQRFDRANKSMLDSIMRWSKALELIGPLVETVASLGIAIGLVYAYVYGMGPGTFITIVTALMSIYPHAKELSRVQLVIQKCIVATSAVFAVMDQKPEVEDAPDAAKIKRANGRVDFQDITFHYSDPKGRKLAKPAVQSINLTLEPGKFYALVGPSGAGKSTLFSLLLRFYDPDGGKVLLDGKDIRSITQESLRSNIGVVSQDTFLFHDSIKENIRYGRLDATDDEIIAAAKRAHLHDFIMSLKQGYQTVVGDAGSNLSGGQKQRVSIARAILRDAPILLLDEATSALDTETEKVIQEAIHELSTGRTVIAIAHRLSTVLEANQIVVMKDGRIEAIAPHAELLLKSDVYQRLYQLQFQESQISEETE